MRHFLTFIFLISSLLSFGQAEQKEKKAEKVSTPMNNSVSEPALEEVQSISTSKSKRSAKQQQTQQVSSNLSVTLSQASRMRNQKSYTNDQNRKLSAGVRQLKSIDETSFEYHLYNYLKTPYNFSEIESLKKAESINAYDYSVLTSFAAYHFIQGNKSELDAYLSRLYQGKYFSDDLIEHADIVLRSLPKNSILITHGKEDTYPVLINQKIKKIRSDVEIISLDHLLSEMYRKQLKTKGFKLPNRTSIDTEFLNQFVKANQGRKIVCANTLPAPYLKAIDSDLNVVGFGFSPVVSRNSNVKFYENELLSKLPRLISKSNKVTLSNSLPLLFDVRNHYIDKGRYEESAKVESWIRAVGKSLGRSEQINSLLK